MLNPSLGENMKELCLKGESGFTQGHRRAEGFGTGNPSMWHQMTYFLSEFKNDHFLGNGRSTKTS